MILTESINPIGRLTIQVRDRNEDLVNEMAANNSIVLTGRDLVALRFIGQGNAISHVAVGTGTVATDPNATAALDTELFRKAINPINLATDLTTTLDGKRKIALSSDLDFNEGNGALTEAGLFNAASGGVLYNRVLFPPVNKTIDFKLTLIWEITF